MCWMAVNESLAISKQLYLLYLDIVLWLFQQENKKRGIFPSIYLSYSLFKTMTNYSEFCSPNLQLFLQCLLLSYKYCLNLSSQTAFNNIHKPHRRFLSLQSLKQGIREESFNTVTLIFFIIKSMQRNTVKTKVNMRTSVSC